MKPHPFAFRVCLLFVSALVFSISALAQPTLVSISPTIGATGVATNTAVVFQFSEKMNVNSGSGLTWVAVVNSIPVFLDSSMTYQWSVDARSLTARCTGGFPSGALVSWSMNATEFTRFTDDFELAQDYGGGFNTAAGSGGGGGGAGTGDAVLSVVIQASYSQFSVAAPVLDPTNSYFFSASVELPLTRVATNATVTPPGRPTTTLSGYPPNSPTEFTTGTASNSLSQLQASFPTGTYQFSVQGPLSNQLANVTLPAGSLPAAPVVVNYAAAQTVDPALPFTLQFNAGGVSTNFVFIQIEDALTSQTIYESPDLGTAGALNGSSNHVRFAAGTFQAGRNYDVHIERYVVFSNAVSGAVSLAGYGAATQSKLRTTGGAMSHIVRITNPTKLGNSFSVVASLGTNATYHFERTVDLTNWISLQTLVPTSTNIQVVVDLNPTNTAAFYRFRRE